MSTAQPDSRNRRTGAAIRRRRHVLGWEQRELAEKVGVHVNSVQKWEAGTHFPGRKLGKLEEVLGIRLDEPGEPEMPTPEELERLKEHIREVLGPKAPVMEDALDRTLAGNPPPTGGSRKRGPSARSGSPGDPGEGRRTS